MGYSRGLVPGLTLPDADETLRPLFVPHSELVPVLWSCSDTVHVFGNRSSPKCPWHRNLILDTSP